MQRQKGCWVKWARVALVVGGMAGGKWAGAELPVEGGPSGARIENPYRPSPSAIISVGELPTAVTAAAVAAEATVPGRMPEARSAGNGETVVLTKEHLSRQLELVTLAVDLDEATRADLGKKLLKAGEWLAAADEAAAKSAQFAGEIQQAPKLVEEAKRALTQPASDPVIEIPPGTQLLQVEQQLSQAETRLSEARDELNRYETELKRRTERHAELSKLIAEKTQQLSELDKQRAAPAPTAEKPLVTQVRQMEQQARQFALQRQAEQYKLEIQRMDTLAEFAPLQRDVAKRSVAGLEKTVAEWQRVVAEVRKRESQRQAEETRQQAEVAHPALAAVAQRNAELAEKRKAIASSIERVTSELKLRNKQLGQLRADFERLQEKVQVAGLSKTIGILLRKQQVDLNALAKSREMIRFIEQEMPAAQLTLIELEDERSMLGDVEQTVQDMVASLSATLPECDHAMLMHTASALLTTKRQLLDSSIYDYNAYLRELIELELSCRRLTTETAAFAEFIDRHVLWIRSAEPLGIGELRRAIEGVVGWIDVQLWLSMISNAWNGLLRRPLHGAGGLLLISLLVMMRRRLFGRLQSLCQTESGNSTLLFWPTLEAMSLVATGSLVWPSLMWCGGWWLESSPLGTDVSNALAHGLQRGAAFLCLFQVVRVTTRSGGLGETHFGWHASGTKVVRETLLWLGALGLPIAVIVSVADRWDDGQGNDPVGRLAFILGMILTATAMHNVFRRQKGMLQEALARVPQGWLNRVRMTGYLAGTGIPCVLAVLTAAGYYYSARQLAVRFEMSMLVVLGLVGLHGVLSRWLLVKRRNIAIRQARERRQNQAEQSSDIAKVLQPPPAPAQDMTKIQSQLQYLLRYGATLAVLTVSWYIWSDVLPALRILDRVVLWTSTQAVVETAGEGDSPAYGERVEKQVPTTLTHVLLALILAAATFALGKNFPALLEITVLERLPIDHGGRHAAAIIFRYLVYLTGLMLACRTLSVSWTSVQWLAAAMTVGLGFGLQEIFANLVSGLIILFERPIRVGDLVTVNGTTGTVSRMQIRATTITDFDRREMIVPNKKFITEDVINWTLS
ncbi:MAG: mechanosensitive ion channel domain-containing protein, partial [Pirellulaceae bacterium]